MFEEKLIQFEYEGQEMVCFVSRDKILKKSTNKVVSILLSSILLQFSLKISPYLNKEFKICCDMYRCTSKYKKVSARDFTAIYAWILMHKKINTKIYQDTFQITFITCRVEILFGKNLQLFV